MERGKHAREYCNCVGYACTNAEQTTIAFVVMHGARVG